MKLILKTTANRFVSAFRLLIGAIAFLPILFYVIWVNYTVDCSGTFQGDQYLREVASMLLSGQDVVGYEQLNERQRDVMELIVSQMETAPDTIVLGSSRIMQMNTDIAQVDSLFNCALTGADWYDMLGTFYLFDKMDKLPKNVIIGFDPWLFDTSPDSTDARSNKRLYAEFLSTRLGIPTQYEAQNPNEKWQALYSLSYFQGNISYMLQSKDGVKKPQPVEGDVYDQTTEVKRSDGSLLYSYEFRNRSQSDVDNDALGQTSNFFRMEEYTAPDTERLEIFEKFLSYLQSKQINVILVLTPYHPLVYDNALEKADHYSGFFATEPALHRIAEKLDIPVYGSYNPYAIPNTSNADFYDGIHVRGECIARYFPGVPKALENIANHVDVTLDYETTAEQAELRDSGLAEDSDLV